MNRDAILSDNVYGLVGGNMLDDSLELNAGLHYGRGHLDVDRFVYVVGLRLSVRHLHRHALIVALRLLYLSDMVGQLHGVRRGAATGRLAAATAGRASAGAGSLVAAA